MSVFAILTETHPSESIAAMKNLHHKPILWVAVLAAGLILSGCGTLPRFQIALDSDPEGMRVEVNNDYIGKTPTTYTVPGNADRSFNGSWVQRPDIEFVAKPPHDQT